MWLKTDGEVQLQFQRHILIAKLWKHLQHAMLILIFMTQILCGDNKEDDDILILQNSPSLYLTIVQKKKGGYL